MAEKSIADSNQDLPSDSYRQPNSKDMHGSDNSKPLSPQWLQPKSGDIKTGTLNSQSEGHQNIHTGEHTNFLKGPESAEDIHDVTKRKEVYKPVLHDPESRDRWHDEERETNPAIRRDNRGERWPDNFTRNSGDRRSLPEHRWGESGNRESGFDQRRGSKWNTSWGPNDKESEANKDGPSRFTSHAKDIDREGELHPRPWRSSSSMARGKADSFYPQPLTPHKQTYMVGYGRGKGDNGVPLSPSRGSFNVNNNSTVSSRPHHLTALPTKPGLQSGSSLRYGRMKLLDIYKMTDIKSHIDGILEVPSMIRSEPSEPLAFSSPTVEELLILKSIEKGEVASSGESQVFKEGVPGRNSVEIIVPEHMKLGTHDDLQYIGRDYKVEGIGGTKIYDGGNPNIVQAKLASENPYKKAGNITEEMGIPEIQFPRTVTPWRSNPEDISNRPTYLKNNPALRGARPSEFNWSHLSEIETSSGPSVSSTLGKDTLYLQNNRLGHAESIGSFKSRNSEPLPLPEELSFCYRDPQGLVQGPFSGIDLIGWFEAGYFGIDLEVRLANAPPDSPFVFLGDAIPQLRLKARPPPGFCPAKQNEVLELSNRDKAESNVFSAHPGLLEQESSVSLQTDNLISTKADNRFLESLMSTSLRGSAAENPSEGMHARGVHSPAPSPVGDRGNDANYLLAQRRWLEQQKQNPQPNSLPLLPGRDFPPMASASQQSHLPNFCEKQAPRNNNNAYENKMDALQDHHPGPHLGFPAQQHQNLPYLPQLLNQPAIASSLASPGQLPSSDVAQDAQMLNFLTQHYLLSQPPMHSQVSVPSQISLLNECFLLKQQLQQQQHQLLLHQQQLLLSQVLSGQQSVLHLGEPSQKLQAAVVSAGDTLPDHFITQQAQAPSNQYIVADDFYDSTAQSESFRVSNKASASMQLPHQMLDSAFHSNKHEGAQYAVDYIAPDTSVALRSDSNLLAFNALAESVDASQCNVNFQGNVPNLTILKPSELNPLERLSLSQHDSSRAGFISPIVDQIHDFTILPDDWEVDEHLNANVPAVKDPKNEETCKLKKTSEKKARKKKNAKVQLSLDFLKGFSTENQLEQPEKDPTPFYHDLSEVQTDILKQPDAFVSGFEKESPSIKPADFPKLYPSASMTEKEAEIFNKKIECIDSRFPELTSLRAWKSAPGVKAKSLKEIQQEEQQSAQIEKSSIAMKDVVPSSIQASVRRDDLDHILSGVTAQDDSRPDGKVSSKTRKSPLHDLLAEEVLAHSTEAANQLSRDNKEQQVPSIPLPTVTFDAVSVVNDDDFIQAKDTKKGRKKVSKAKVSAAKIPSPVGSYDLPSPMASEKKKTQKQAQKEKETLPALPSVPSLADFVTWKGDSVIPLQAPAWSVGIGKVCKPSSLREIQKEQETIVSAQQNISMPATPAKVQSNRGNLGSTSLQVFGSSPSTGSLIQSITLTSRQSMPEVEDDLFWGPVDQSKRPVDQSKRPVDQSKKPVDQSKRLIEQSVAKSPASSKPIAITKQKPSNSKPADHSPLSMPILPASKSKKDDDPSNLTEAIGFRDWCEKELIRLTGANDTSLLQYCLKQSTSEAEMLLKENLGSLDRNHDFIDKFLSYKDFLSSKVIEMAFRANDRRPAPDGRDAGLAMAADAEADFSGKSGKKKGKKGKKVSAAAVLGFNVVSNRIMMGDIQTADD